MNLVATDGNITRKDIHAGGVITDVSYGCGYYEIVSHVASSGSSYMPAFWLLRGDNCDCPNSCPGWYREIYFLKLFVIVEHLTFQVMDIIILGNCNHNNGQDLYSPYVVNGNDLFNNFHTYGYEWTPGRVIFYLDGEPYRVMESSLIDDTPLKLWINMDFNGSTITDATFTGNLHVDSVRIYNLRRGCISGNLNEEILNNSDLINFVYMANSNQQFFAIKNPHKNIYLM